ncbi:hypothetical protein GP486_007083 [Trichoglossum hirsutum]|uniref:Uncharacterized protein n=1 Tax=Trichoglossum hirsutum TaxID=265104 RepID=A0A9P8L7P1_9PEZI|nr:hypothetical protein GP486_007083 [Trichoglossum hirsutum]
MSRRTAVPNGEEKEHPSTTADRAQQEQKLLLSSDTGHFSLIKSDVRSIYT